MDIAHMGTIVSIIESQKKLIDLVEQLADSMHGEGSSRARAIQTELAKHRKAMADGHKHFAQWI